MLILHLLLARRRAVVVVGGIQRLGYSNLPKNNKIRLDFEVGRWGK